MYTHAKILITLYLFSLPLFNIAQTAYYTALLQELQNTHGITGGTFVVGGNENLLDNGTYGNVDFTINNITGEVFERSVSLSVTNAGPNPWSQMAFFLSQAAVSQGDILLFTSWVRNNGNDGKKQLAMLFQEASAPWQVSFYDAMEVPNDGAWYQVYIPFTANLDHPSGEAFVQLHLGFEELNIEFGGLAVINYGNQYQEGDLPDLPVLYYDGIEEDASWRMEANDRIEQHRKANLEVLVRDNSGNPIEGATVQVSLQNPSFRFGSVDDGQQLLNNAPSADFYKEEFYRLFNYGTVGIYWSINESNNYETSVANAQIMLDNGLDVRAHPILWGSTGAAWSSMPPDIVNAIQNNNVDYVKTRIDEHIEDIADQLSDLITDFDCLNEPSHITTYQDLLGQEEQIHWFEKTKQEMPDRPIFINDYEQLSLGAEPAPIQAYKDVISYLLENDTPMEGIGFQAHMFDVTTPPERVYQVLEEFNQLAIGFGQDLELKITEYDHAGMNDELAGLYFRDFLIALFSHPKVTSFTMWGFMDAQHWLDDAPFYDENWNPKPALAAYENLVFEEWWTEESELTDAIGRTTTRGFKGDYSVEVTFDGETMNQFVSLTEDGSLEFIFDVVEINDIKLPNTALKLYPSILNKGDSFTIESLLKEDWTSIEIINPSGQMIYSDKTIQPKTSISTEGFGGGLYYVRVWFGEEFWEGNISLN